MRLALCLPTRGRPDLAFRAASSALSAAVDPKPSLYVRLDSDDTSDYGRLIDISTGHKVGTRGRPGNVDHINDIAKVAHDAGADLLMQVDDDMVFRSEGWNIAFLKAAEGVPFAAFCTHAVEGENRFVRPLTLTRRWLSRTGSFYPPTYRHYFADTEVNEIARGIGARIFVPGVQIQHTKVADDLDARTECWREDALVFAARADLRLDLIERMQRR